MRDDERLHHLATLFEERFGRSPCHGASAPGRVNLIGEHTDYNDGFVLPIAIDRRTIVLAAPADGDASSIHSLELDRTARFDLTGPLAPIPRGADDFFANYVLGVVREFGRLGHRLPNLDLLVASDVPVGAGLSSSAALEVAIATLLEAVLDLELDPMEKMLLCRRAEHAFPGTPCGIMDMFIATGATSGHALLIDCRSNESMPIPLPPADRIALLILDTGVRHELASGEYADRRRTCARVAAQLGVPALRDATLAMLHEAQLAETAMKRATHVITENTRTLLAAEALRQGDVATVGGLMFDSHASLRELFAVSCPELDAIVNSAAARKGRGVHGARMTGGGFGGCAIVLCEAGAAADVTTRIREEFETAFGRTVHPLPARADDGARVESLG